MAGLNIVFIASEAAPLAKTGGLADVAGTLPLALQHLGHRVSVILPYYRKQIDATGTSVRATDKGVDIWADRQQWHCPIHEAESNGLKFILIEQDELFDRDGLYGPPGDAYADNLLRYTVFNRAALELSAHSDTAVDILHCHDWQTGMIPLLLKSQYLHYPAIARAKTVFTIHNLAYQGIFDADWIGRLGIPTHHFHHDGFEFHHQINCMKAGILMADEITTVSQTYAEEICTPEYGCGLDGFLLNHTHKLAGIVNGLDIEAWNPATDTHIRANYEAGKSGGKKVCKQTLQEKAGLTIDADAPLMAAITRLAEQKGIDLLLAAAPRWIAQGYQLAMLGSGDPHTEQQLRELAAAHPDQFFFRSGFNESLAREIYAAADIFLMPSRFEPCGLGQLMAMRYGAVPVVRATGGLKDTVCDFDAARGRATGFHFREATIEAFDAAVERAVAIYRQPAVWSRLTGRAMRRDSSWQASAAQYDTLYKTVLKRR